jgi:serine/threonine-protein kinase HipA
MSPYHDRDGLAVTKLAHAAGKDVLLVRRFDPEKTAKGWARKAMVSALTLLELDEMSRTRRKGYASCRENCADATCRSAITSPSAPVRFHVS